MADEQTPTPDNVSADTSKKAQDAGDSGDRKPDIRPAMTEQEIRDAGLAIDVPFETTGEPDRLQYANLGKPWKADETTGDQQ